MGIISRLANLWTGFVNLWISDIEKEHPEIAYQNAIMSRNEQFMKLKKAAAAIIRRRDEITARFKKASSELATINADIETAMDIGDDEAAVILLEKQASLEKTVIAVEEEMAVAISDADKVKISMNEVKGAIEELKSEKDRNLAKFHSAEARNKINEQLDGISNDDDVMTLDGVREHINNTVAEANLSDELKENDIDTRLKALRQKSGGVSAAKKLEAMKAARTAKETVQTEQMQEFQETVARSTK